MCEVCNTPADRGVITDVDPAICPFICPSCKKIVFPVKPMRDIVFMWPIPGYSKIAPKSSLEIVTNKFNDHMKRSNVGLILACGPGYHKSGKFFPMGLTVGMKVMFDNTTPWHSTLTNFQGRKFSVRYMAEPDVQGILEED